MIRDPECSTGAPNHRGRRRAWSSCSDGTEAGPPGSSAPHAAWAWPRYTWPHGPVTRPYPRGHRPEKSDRPRNRHRWCSETRAQPRVDDLDGDAPALGVLRDPQGFADTAAGSRRGRDVASRRRSCACSAPGLGRTNDRRQTGSRTDGTTGDGPRRRTGRAHVRTSRNDRPAPRPRRRPPRRSPWQRSNRTRRRCPAIRVSVALSITMARSSTPRRTCRSSSASKRDGIKLPSTHGRRS